MSRSILKETSSLAFGIVGRLGGSSAGFVVAALNAASAACIQVVVLRVLSAGILCPNDLAFPCQPSMHSRPSVTTRLEFEKVRALLLQIAEENQSICAPCLLTVPKVFCRPIVPLLQDEPFGLTPFHPRPRIWPQRLS